MGKLTDRIERLAHAWNAFDTPTDVETRPVFGPVSSFGSRPDRIRSSMGNDRSIVTAIYNRIAIDVAAIDIRHVRLDDNNQYLEDMPSYLNRCLTLEANLDQGASHFRQDVAMRLFDKGTIAIVPTDTTLNPNLSGGYDITTLRVGEILDWYPKHVKVKVYDQDTGRFKELILNKRLVAIVENPLYSVMNEPNSTLQRLIRKLVLLDYVDEQSSSGKLDLIIQLPYVIKSEGRRQQAEQRRGDIEAQLKGSKYGIAYTDGTEKITQLNRPAENNMLEQIEKLTAQLYAQLGLTEAVFNGTADEKTMLNYYNRTIEPVLRAISEAMKRTFLTPTARTQKQSIMYFRNPFALVTVEALAEFADKFTRNEIATSNEMRGLMGWRPSKDPKANQLVNSNVPQPAPVDAPPVELKQITP